MTSASKGDISLMATSTIVLPDEILFYILNLLDPSEIIQLRLVSRQFNNVSRDAQLWRALYSRSRLPRRPGPFLWQSTLFLERALIHSARVSQTWTSQPMCVGSRAQGPRVSTKPSPISTPFDFLFGRLFIWCEGEQLLAQDIETGMGRLLWESPEPISSLRACSLTLPDSERVIIALRYIDEPIHKRTPIRLLEFQIQDDARLVLGPPTFEMDMPMCTNFPPRADGPYLYFDEGIDRLFGYPYESLLMDTRTWAIFRFPMFASNLDVVNRSGPPPWWPTRLTLPSEKHFLVFRYFAHWNPPMTLIQAFVAPDPSAYPPEANTSQLRLSHEVLINFCDEPSHQLRAPIVDPVTGETRIRLLSVDTRDGQARYVCVDIIIPPTPSHSTEVLPMFASAQELFALSGRKRTLFFGASSDGHGRGILTMAPSSFPPMPGHNPAALYKFSVDASGERCTAVVSESRNLTAQDVFQYVNCCIFDGVTGRLCHGVRVQQHQWDELVGLDLR